MLGCLVFVISTIIPLPQAIRIYKDRAARDVSIGTIQAGIVAQALWITYGWLQQDFYLWAASIPALCIYIGLGYIYIKYEVNNSE